MLALVELFNYSYTIPTATRGNKMHNQIAVTILEQIGGNRFIAMTGCKQIVALADGVQFGIGRGAQFGINKVKITLQTDDRYRVVFYKIRGVDIKEIGQVVDVYADNSARVFSEMTGFDTRL